MRRLILLFAAVSVPVAASTPDAWNAHYRDVVRRCFAASGLTKPRADGHLMPFSDAIGTALLVRGTLKGHTRETRKLCIVRRSADGEPEVQSVDDGIDPRTLPK